MEEEVFISSGDMVIQRIVFVDIIEGDYWLSHKTSANFQESFLYTQQPSANAKMAYPRLMARYVDSNVPPKNKFRQFIIKADRGLKFMTVLYFPGIIFSG